MMIIMEKKLINLIIAILLLIRLMIWSSDATHRVIMSQVVTASPVLPLLSAAAGAYSYR